MTRRLGRVGRGEFVLISLVFVIFAALLSFAPSLYGYALMEDMPPEWFSFFLLLWGTGLWGHAAVQRRRQRQWIGMAFCAGMAALSFFVAGEELAWGQRLFHIKPPVYFLHRNVQREITIHNIPHPLMRPRVAAMVLMVVYGVAGSVIPRLFGSVDRFAQRVGIPTPSLGGAFGFALATWAMTFPITATDDEAGELFFALSLTVTGLLAGRTADRTRAPLPWKVLSALVIVSVVASCLSFLSAEHRDHIFNVGHLQAGMACEGRGMTLEAAQEFEALANYWKTDWDLWVKVMGLYYAGGNIPKAQELAFDFVRINKRVWRPFEILAEIARRTGERGETEKVFRAILVDEPYNDLVHRAMMVMNGRRWLYQDGESVEHRTSNVQRPRESEKED